MAQELQKILPSALREDAVFMPTIYKLVSNLQVDGKYTEIPLPNHQLAKGDIVQFYVHPQQDSSADVTLETEVVEVSAISFIVQNLDSAYFHKFDQKFPDNYENITQAFVYGKLVTDGLSVDYNQIMVTNVSATQALIRDNTILKEDNKQLKNGFEVQKARIRKLEQAVQQLIVEKGRDTHNGEASKGSKTQSIL